jgi:hypothetical protein
VVPGTTTAIGGWRSKPASYSNTRRSSGCEKTCSAPQIATSSWTRL